MKKIKNILISNGSNLLRIAKAYIHNNPKVKKAIGVILMLIGLAALLTPFTPGSWLIFIGLELLGVRILLFGPLRCRFSAASKLKFWKRK